ncbi:type II secretion system minor pseudopilin GspK [Archangium sp.]|uniref:general secretion pathway protein GspK n=1 Tax=Archangium sp. TaxID=1872627 RepID=UPI002D37E545|nr:type II secretion system minor pseudopilin GspK [Archangium sp.]HYO52907.1 type II secretion system minor pseudopilin GspK [Archangium sp.]
MTSPKHTEARRAGAHRDARGERRQRGVALIIAVVAITILTVVATEFAYNTRVDLQLAANQRDEVQAMYMARSGVALSRLLLRFQKQVDQTPIPNLGGMLSQLTGGGGAAGGGAPGGGAPGGQQPASSLNIQLWKLARVDCHMLKGLVASAAAEGEDDEAPAEPALHDDDEVSPELSLGPAKRSFGGFSGCFLATIQDEEEKLNLHRLNAGTGDALPTAMRLMDLLGDKRFEFLFSREDANGVRVTPQDVLIAIKDWVDDDKTQSAIDLNNTVNPFAAGFSDENSPYSRLDPRYEAKNARFDSMDELYRVHGVNDRFMAAFRDRLTVYPDVNSKPNVNTDDPLMMHMAILSAADPARPDPRLRDPVFVQELISRIRAARAFSFFGMGVADFVSAIEAAGIAVNPQLKANVAGNRLLGDKSNTFSIKSVGEAGSVQKTITAVVKLDDALGKLLYWREE